MIFALGQREIDSYCRAIQRRSTILIICMTWVKSISIFRAVDACGHHHVGHIGILGVDKKVKSTRFHWAAMLAMTRRWAIFLALLFEADVLDVIEKNYWRVRRKRHEPTIPFRGTQNRCSAVQERVYA